MQTGNSLVVLSGCSADMITGILRASAMSMALFLALIAVTLVQMRFLRAGASDLA